MPGFGKERGEKGPILPMRRIDRSGVEKREGMPPKKREKRIKERVFSCRWPEKHRGALMKKKKRCPPPHTQPKKKKKRNPLAFRNQGKMGLGRKRLQGCMEGMECLSPASERRFFPNFEGGMAAFKEKRKEGGKRCCEALC